MKKIFLSAAVAAFMFASCQNENIVEQDAQQEMQEFTVQVTKGIDSRVAMDGTVAVWSEGDELYVYGKKNTSGVLTLVDGAGTETATFTGYINGSAANLTDALFGAEIKSDKISYTLSKVDAKEIDFPMHGKFVDGTSNIELTNICGLVALNIDGLKSTDVVTLKGSGIAGEGTYKDGEWTAEGVNTIEVMNATDKTTFYVPVFAAEEEADAVVTVGIENGDTFGTSVTIKNGAISTGISNLKLSGGELEDAEGEKGTDYVYTASELYKANKKNAVIELAADVEIDSVFILKSGATLNGNGNYLNRIKEGNGYQKSILVTEGAATIKNLKFRETDFNYGIKVYGEGDVTIENCVFESNCSNNVTTVKDGKTVQANKRSVVITEKAGGILKMKNCQALHSGYAFYVVSNNDVDFIVEGGTMTGWMSYSDIKSVEFEGVTFNPSNTEPTGINPYQSTTFKDCIFNYPFTINRGNGNLTHYLNGCTFNGYETMLDLVTNDGDGEGGKLNLSIDGLLYEFAPVVKTETEE